MRWLLSEPDRLPHTRTLSCGGWTSPSAHLRGRRVRRPRAERPGLAPVAGLGEPRRVGPGALVKPAFMTAPGTPEEGKGCTARSLRPGFYWKERAAVAQSTGKKVKTLNSRIRSVPGEKAKNFLFLGKAKGGSQGVAVWDKRCPQRRGV